MRPTALSCALAAAFLAGSGAARADIAPYTVDVSQRIRHESNVFRSSDPARLSDWVSTTSLSAGLDQPLGRERLTGSAEVDRDAYLHQTQLDDIGYLVNSELDWATVGNLSGALGARLARRQYQPGLLGDQASVQQNLQRTRHVFANTQLGGPARWTVTAGLDASDRDYSSSAFAADDLRQVAGNTAAQYRFSGDLAAGLTADYVRGRYPRFEPSRADVFSMRTFGASADWQLTANHHVILHVGRTSEIHSAQPDRTYWNGALTWQWMPPGRLSGMVIVRRDASADQSVSVGAPAASAGLSGRSLNTTGAGDLHWAITPKTSVQADIQLVRREYDHVQLPQGPFVVQVTGFNRLLQFGVTVGYKPLRSVGVSCSFQREIMTTDAAMRSLTPQYHAITASCQASLKFR